jgi:hypothetical protein
MDTQMTVIVLCYLAVLVFGFFLFRGKKEQPTVSVPQNDYVTLFAILDETIKREITYKNNLDYKLKDVRIIYDFKEDLTELTEKVMASIADPFLKELEYYHSRQYIIRYVTRYIQVFLIEFTKANKIKTM